MDEPNDTVDTADAPDPEVTAEATSMGWVDKEKFKGNPDKWVPAEEFVRRGKEVLPILRKNNAELKAELGKSNLEIQALKETVKGAQAAIKALEESHDADVRTQVDAARKDVVAKLKAARESGDVDAEVALIGELTKLDAAAGQPPAKKTNGEGTKAPEGIKDVPLTPEFVAWQQANTWFGKDGRKTRIALAIADDLRSDSANAGLTGSEFFSKVNEELAKIFEPAPARGSGKVEGSRGGSTQGRSSGGRGYNDLPSEAKQTCDRMADRHVGPNRAHKDLASWRKFYATKFFEE